MIIAGELSIQVADAAVMNMNIEIVAMVPNIQVVALVPNIEVIT